MVTKTFEDAVARALSQYNQSDPARDRISTFVAYAKREALLCKRGTCVSISVIRTNRRQDDHLVW